MKSIVRKRQRRNLIESGKGELAFTVRGNTVAPENVDRWMKRNKIDESALYVPSPAACKRAPSYSLNNDTEHATATPSAVGCWTISERDSPAPSSTYSASTPTFPIRDMLPFGQSLHPSSPASSISSIVRYTESTFAGQSPAPDLRTIPSFVDGPTVVQESHTVQPGPPQTHKR
jgi:hypothetical protein